MRPVDKILDRLERVRATSGGWSACCPAHDDRNPSLSVKEGDNDAVLIHCFAGCEVADIVAALGLQLSDLFPPKDSSSRGNSLVQRNFTRPPGARPERPERPEPEPEPRPELRRVDLRGFSDRTLPPHPHVMACYYPRRVVTLLGGHGGLGKTTLALIHAAHVAAGRGWGPFDVTPGRVAFLSFEDEEAELVRTLRNVVDVYGLPAAEVESNLDIFDGTEIESEMAVEVAAGGASSLQFTPLMETVEEMAAGADLVIIDNASDTFGGNENSRRQVKAFIRRLAREIARRNNAAVVLLAHIAKDAAKGGAKGNSYSGSTAWHNGARSRLALVEVEDGGIELLHEKARFGRRAEPLRLHRTRDEVLEILTPQQADSIQGGQALLAQHDAEIVLEVMRVGIQAGLVVPTARTGQRTTWHALCELPELPAHLRERKRGKDRLAAALTALERAGSIHRETYRTVDRKDRERWALAQTAAKKVA